MLASASAWIVCGFWTCFAGFHLSFLQHLGLEVNGGYVFGSFRQLVDVAVAVKTSLFAIAKKLGKPEEAVHKKIRRLALEVVEQKKNCSFNNFFWVGFAAGANYADNGVDIAEDQKSRLLEREFGKRNGIGLRMIKQIIDTYGWKLEENGESGVGARFVMNSWKQLQI